MHTERGVVSAQTASLHSAVCVCVCVCKWHRLRWWCLMTHPPTHTPTPTRAPTPTHPHTHTRRVTHTPARGSGGSGGSGHRLSLPLCAICVCIGLACLSSSLLILCLLTTPLHCTQTYPCIPFVSPLFEKGHCVRCHNNARPEYRLQVVLCFFRRRQRVRPRNAAWRGMYTHTHARTHTHTHTHTTALRLLGAFRVRRSEAVYVALLASAGANDTDLVELLL